MVSTNTPNRGIICCPKALICQTSSASHHNPAFFLGEVSTAGIRFWWKQLLYLCLTSLLLLFVSQSYGQTGCVANCVNHSQIAIDDDGVTELTPAMFFNGDPSSCAQISISPDFVSCSDVGNNVIVTLTAVANGGNTTTCKDTFLVVETMAPWLVCPPDTSINCTEGTSPAVTGMATATDNCTIPGNITITYSDSFVGSGDCYVIERRWIAEDAYGNMDTCYQSITVIDTVAPVLSFPYFTPPNQTIQCGASLPPHDTATVLITDNCNHLLSIFTTEVGRSGNPTHCEYYQYQEHRTWRVVDDCGNSDEFTQVFTRIDDTKPVFTGVGSHSHSFSTISNCQAMVTLNLTGKASDNCASGAYLIEYYIVIEQVSGDTVKIGNGLNASGMYQAGVYDFEFFAVDPCGNVGKDAHIVEVMDAEPPVAKCKDGSITVSSSTGMTTIPVSSINDGSWDNCTPQNQLVFRLSPAVVNCDSIGQTIMDTLFVTDANGNTDYCTANLVIQPGAPTALCDTIFVNLDASGSYTLTSGDINNLGGLFIDMCTTTPLTFSASPTLFDCDDIGNNFVTVTGTNSFGKSSSCQAMVQVRDRLRPNTTCRAGFMALLDGQGNIGLQGGWLLDGAHEIYMLGSNNGSGNGGNTDFKVTASTGAVLSFDWEYTTDDVSAANDSFGYLINNTKSWLTTGTSTSQSGSASIGISAGEMFTFRIHSVNNQGGAASVRIFNVSLTGDFYPANWTQMLSNSNGKAFIAGNTIQSIDNCTSLWDIRLSINPNQFGCDSLGFRTVVVTARDESNNVQRCTTTLEVKDLVPPVIECADFTAQLLTVPGFFTPGVTVEPTWFLADPSSVFIESGTIGGSPANVSYYTTVKTATSVSFSWNFMSSDTVGHERFGYIKGNTFVQLSNGSLTSGNVTVGLTNGERFGFRIISDHDVDPSKAHISNFSRTNQNGRFFSGDFDPVRWVRNPDPIPSGRAFIYGNATDNCSPIEEMDITMSINSGPFVYEQNFSCLDAFLLGVATVDIRVIDAQGNVSFCSANLRIIDNEPPIAGCPAPFSTTLNQAGFYPVRNPTLLNIVSSLSFDNCFIPLDSIMVNPDTLDCSNVGPNLVTFTVKDLFGNASTCTTTITIQENTPPAIVCPADISVNCQDLPQDTIPANAGFATATDNCGMTSITYRDQIVNRFGPSCYTIQRRWTARDDSGNASSCIQSIVVFDNFSPIILATQAQADTFINCQPIAPVTPGYVDSCVAFISLDTIDSRIDYGPDTLLAGSKPGECGYYNYTITRDWTLTDSCGHFDYLTQYVYVQDTTRPAFSYPSMIMVNNDTSKCGANINLRITTADISDCADYQYLDFVNNSGRGNGKEDASGYYPVGTSTVTFYATDPCGNVAMHVVTIVVKDVETPNVNCVAPGTIDVYLNSNGRGTLPILQIDRGSSDNCGITTLRLVPNTFDCSDLGVQTVVLTAIDLAGGTARCTTSVTVKTASGIAINCPAPTTVMCPTLPDPMLTGMPTYTSSCGASSISYNDTLVSGNDDCGTLERTWHVTNGVITQSCKQVITLVDNSKPSMPAAPMDTVVNCEALLPALSVTATDACKGTFQVDPVSDTMGRGADPTMASYYNFMVYRTWTASDNCGNDSIDMQIVTVQDTTRPELNFPMPLVIPTGINKCDTLIHLDVADLIQDNCASDAHLMYSINGVPTNRIISGTYAKGTYNFTVVATDPSGNTNSKVLTIVIEDQQSPDAECIPSVIIVLDNTGNANIGPLDVDAGSSDNCTLPGMLSLSVVPNTFTTADIGNVQLTLTAEDEAGLTNSCTTNGIVIGGTIFVAPHAVSPEGGMDTIPISVENFQDVTSFELDVDVDDPSIADVVDLLNINPALSNQGIFSFSTNANGYFVQWIDTSATPGLSFADGTSLFSLKVNITGTSSEVANIWITNNEVSKLIAGVPTLTVSSVVDGSITVFSPSSLYTLSGTISSELGVPTELVTVDLSGTSSGSLITGPGGGFSFNVASGANSTITPTKNINWSNGITTADAFYVLQHVAGSRLLASPYARIAADANKDNVVTTFDAFNILQLALGNIASIPGNTSWRFVPAIPALPLNPFGSGFDEFFHYQPVLMDSSNIDFIAIKTGDVDSSAFQNMKPLPQVHGTSGIFHFQILDESVENVGSIVAVPIRAKGFAAVNTFQFTLDFDKDALDLVEVVPGHLPNMTLGNFNQSFIEKGQLASGWMSLDPVTLEDGKELFTIYFKVKKAGSRLSALLSASDHLIPMEVLLAGVPKIRLVDLVFETTTGTQVLRNTGFELRQNIPNPFKDETIIGFVLPQSCEARLTVLDASGKVIRALDGYFKAGYNEFKINRSELPALGIYFYRLDSETGTATRKMLFFD